jgi:predicted transglutaminase-like cysteine proteinase
MFGRFAARSVAVLLLLSLPIFGDSSAALAQYQVNVNIDVSAEPPSQPAVISEPFGLHAVPVTSGGVLTKWSGVVADIKAEGEILTRCREAIQSCPAAARAFLTVIADGRAHQGRARIGVINRAINMAIQPMSDLAQWGVPDRWSAPLETLTTGRGDCEDYAIAKYVALREAGVAEDDVRLVIVHDLVVGQDHAVVAARLDGKWIVLDNRRLILLQDVEMPRVLPLFVLDDAGVKQFAPTSVADAHDVTIRNAAAAPAPSSLDSQISPL